MRSKFLQATASAVTTLLLATAASAAEPPAKAAAAPSFQPFDLATVRADDTLDSLRKRFGRAEVKADDIPGAEETVPGWILHPDDPQRRVYIYLDEAGKHPADLMVQDPESRWQRDDGLHMGLTLTDLVARNGKPVEFSGFGWDYGGTITQWHGGRLQHARSLTLCPPDFPGGKEPKGYPIGDATFSSNLPVVLRYPPKVCSFGLGEPAGSKPAAKR